MKTDIFPIERDEELLKQRRYWYILAAVLLLVSIVLRLPLVFLASLFVCVVGMVPDLWYRYALRRLVVRQQVDRRLVFFGEDVILSISIENRKLLPLPWLTVENKITPPLAVLSRQAVRLQKTAQDTLLSTWLLWSFQRVTRRYRMRCDTRGLHLFGPVRLKSSDPFGWLETEVKLPAAQALLVYPLIAPLETLGLSSVHPFGEYASERRLLEDPLRTVGVRDYLPGDDPRRIHWKASAHAGALRSKLYEPGSMRRLLLLLDAWNYTDESKGIDTELQELTITTAASLGVWALEEGYQVGLLANCSLKLSPLEELSQDAVSQDAQQAEKLLTMEISAPIARVPFSLDAGQQERLLSTLARLLPSYNSVIERVIETEEDMFPLGTTVVLISAASTLNDATVERLLDLRVRGAAIHLVLTGDAEHELVAETYDLPLHYPGGKERWHALVATIEREGRNGISSTSLQLD